MHDLWHVWSTADLLFLIRPHQWKSKPDSLDEPKLWQFLYCMTVSLAKSRPLQWNHSSHMRTALVYSYCPQMRTCTLLSQGQWLISHLEVRDNYKLIVPPGHPRADETPVFGWPRINGVGWAWQIQTCARVFRLPQVKSVPASVLLKTAPLTHSSYSPTFHTLSLVSARAIKCVWVNPLNHKCRQTSRLHNIQIRFMLLKEFVLVSEKNDRKMFFSQ